MSKYDLRNSQNGAVGDNACSNNATFNMGHGEAEKLDLTSLIEELVEIKQKIEHKQDKTSEDYILLGHIVEIQETAKGGQKKETGYVNSFV